MSIFRKQQKLDRVILSLETCRFRSYRMSIQIKALLFPIIHTYVISTLSSMCVDTSYEMDLKRCGHYNNFIDKLPLLLSCSL